MRLFGPETHRFVFIFYAVTILIIRALRYYLKQTQADKLFTIKHFFRDIDKEYLPYLQKNFPFYNALSNQNKMFFERRVRYFIKLKEFIPRGGIKEVTTEMKALIAGSAIQLTFGYPSIYFRHFRRILIYPDDYYSRITRKYHKGEVNRGGLIVVSLRSLREGFVDPADGHHLGLHEMAHALRLINIINNEEYNFYDRKIMKAFDKQAKIEIEKMVKGGQRASFFRHYGSTNIEEFFAVAVEAFFECSKEFMVNNPELYELLSKILKIDPVYVYQTGEIRR